MSEIKFGSQEKEEMAEKVKRYFKDELDQEIGRFEAEFLIDFFSKEIGGYFYNQGLHDAQAIVTGKLDEVADAIYEIEKPLG